ncbi:hypothetical protein [Ottowia sp.]|uniref:hypothetical protein n=1 Tax=Ottowia sp. TaxID=1898956 RepID=UPI003A8B3AB8
MMKRLSPSWLAATGLGLWTMAWILRWWAESNWGLNAFDYPPQAMWMIFGNAVALCMAGVAFGICAGWVCRCRAFSLWLSLALGMLCAAASTVAMFYATAVTIKISLLAALH